MQCLLVRNSKTPREGGREGGVGGITLGRYVKKIDQ